MLFPWPSNHLKTTPFPIYCNIVSSVTWLSSTYLYTTVHMHFNNNNLNTKDTQESGTRCSHNTVSLNLSAKALIWRVRTVLESHLERLSTPITQIELPIWGPVESVFSLQQNSWQPSPNSPTFNHLLQLYFSSSLGSVLICQSLRRYLMILNYYQI